jgi:hypothetical protein
MPEVSLHFTKEIPRGNSFDRLTQVYNKLLLKVEI